MSCGYDTLSEGDFDRDYSYLDSLDAGFVSRKSELSYEISTIGDTIASLLKATHDVDEHLVVKSLKSKLINKRDELDNIINLLGE